MKQFLFTGKIHRARNSNAHAVMQESLASLKGMETTLNSKMELRYQLDCIILLV